MYMTCCLHSVPIPVSPDVFTQTWSCCIMFHTFQAVWPFRITFSPPPQISSWLIAIIFDLLFFGSFYLMASQDLISHSAKTPMLSLLRNLIVHAHLIDLNMAGTRRYLHFADRCTLQWTTPRPFWHPAGIPPPPPTTTSFSSRPTLDSTHTNFPTYTADVLSTTIQPRQSTPQRHLLPQDRRDLCHPQEEVLQSTKATPVDLLKSHRLTNGNPTLTSMTPTRSTGWISRPGFAKAGFLATKTLRYGSFASPTLEVFVPRLAQYMLRPCCIRTRNFRPSI